MRFFIGLEKDPQKAGGIIDSIFNYGTNVLKKIIKRRKLKSKIYNLIYALRLIFAVCLMSEVRVSNQKVQDLHEKLRALLTNARKYSYVFISNIDKFNTSNNDQRTGILNILLILFRDEDWEIRRAASDAFGKIGTAESISILQPMLRDEVINVRETAIEALSKLGTVKDIPLLQPLLMDKDTDVRSKATQALGKIGTSQHIHFIETLLKDKDEEVQSAAAEALLDMVTVKDIPFLGLLLRDESKDVRRAASDALGTIGTSNDIPLLKPLLKDENEDVRSTAVDNLLKLGAVKDISFLKSLLNNENQWIYRTAAYILMKIGINKDNSILEHLLRNKDMKIRWASAEAIGKIGPSNYISMLEPLLRDVSRHVRSAASEALGNIGSEKDIPLLEPMLSDKNWKVRNAAAYALGNIGTEKDILLLAPLLKDKNRKVRSAAAEALRSIGSEKDIPLLSPLLSDKNWNVRHTAASALLRIGKAQHFALLVPLFIEKGWDDDERSASAALTNMFTEQDIHLLQPLLRDKYKFIRTAATEKLGKIGSSNDIPMLEPQLRDGSRHVRYAAAKALSEIGSEKDILLLQPLLKDNSITVRMGAADALGKLGIENDIPLLQPLLEDNWVIRIASKAIEQIYKRSTPELRIDDDVLPKNGKKESLFFKKAPTHPLHILHISDIHYSQQRYPDIDRIFHEFLGDLTKWQQQRKNEKIHVVCLTGDIANSGMRSQYDAIQEKIKNILSKTGCSNDDLFIVPGNHDVQNYEIISNSGKKTLKEAKKNHTFINFNVLNDFQKYREFNEKFNHYYGFIEKYGYINSQPETHHSISKSLYSRTLVDYPVRIIGLNSALFGIKGFHEYGKIRMGTDQFTEAYLHGKTRNTTTGELVILLTHHPLNWLSEEEYEEFSTLFERYSVVHLHGHIHRLKIRNLFSFSGSSYLSVGTGSLYGAKGTEDINTYHILTFDFEKKEIHIWARRWNPEMGRWTVYDDETRNTFSFPQPRVKTSSD
jgi:HEAT repeat protein/predicted MPP superfamily phosphohydrolase